MFPCAVKQLRRLRRTAWWLGVSQHGSQPLGFVYLQTVSNPRNMAPNNTVATEWTGGDMEPTASRHKPDGIEENRK
jgi:hypothetical protein